MHAGADRNLGTLPVSMQAQAWHKLPVAIGALPLLLGMPLHLHCLRLVLCGRCRPHRVLSEGALRALQEGLRAVGQSNALACSKLASCLIGLALGPTALWQLPTAEAAAALPSCAQCRACSCRAGHPAAHLHLLTVPLSTSGALIKGLDEAAGQGDILVGSLAMWRTVHDQLLSFWALGRHASGAHFLMRRTRLAAAGSRMRSRNSAKDNGCVASANWLSSAICEHTEGQARQEERIASCSLSICGLLADEGDLV